MSEFPETTVHAAWAYGSRTDQALSLVHDEAHACHDCAV